MSDVIYTVSEVAGLLKVNKNSIYNLLKAGIIHGLKLGSIKVTRAELLRFLDDNNGMDLSNLNDIRELKF